MLLQAVSLVRMQWGMPRGLAPGARMLPFLPRAWPSIMKRAFFGLSAPSYLKVMGGGGRRERKAHLLKNRKQFLDTEQSQSLWENKNSVTSLQMGAEYSFTNVKIEVIWRMCHPFPSSHPGIAWAPLSSPSFSWRSNGLWRFSCLLSTLWSQESEYSNTFLTSATSHCSLA